MSIAVHMELCSGFQPSRLLYGGVPGSQVSTGFYKGIKEYTLNHNRDPGILLEFKVYSIIKGYRSLWRTCCMGSKEYMGRGCIAASTRKLHTIRADTVCVCFSQAANAPLECSNATKPEFRNLEISDFGKPYTFLSPDED